MSGKINFSYYLTFIILIFISLSTNGQTDNSVVQPGTKRIKGVVLDDTSVSLPGATIQINGTTTGVITDANGQFDNLMVKETDIIVVSFLGMESQYIPVEGKTTFEVILYPKVSELAEVTVVAFGKQKKESVISSITAVNPSELKVPSSNLTTALAGRISGLIAYQRSGEPGRDNAEFFIRGVTTFGYKKDPLVLLDNVEISSSDLSRMQPDDIASFNIMKDAAATALYGSRGANGVILVTTKEGREGAAKLNVRLEESISTHTDRVELADPVTYMKLHNEAIRTRDALGHTLYSQNKILNTINGGNPYVYPANDWYKTMFNDVTQNQRVNMNLSGGGKVARYYIAATFNNDNGNLKMDKLNNFNSNISLKRYMLRTNLSVSVTKTTDVKVRLQGTFDDYRGPLSGGDDLYKMVMWSNPVLFPAYYKPDAANQYTKHVLFGNNDKAQYMNPYAEMVKGYKDYSVSQMFAQVELEQKLNFITDGLSIRGMFNTSRYAYFDVRRSYVPYYYAVSSYDKKTDEYTLRELNEESGREYLDWGIGERNINTATYFESAINWNRLFEERHNLSAMLVFNLRNFLENKFLFSDQTRYDLQSSLPYRNMGLAGRFTYAFDNRYFAEFNFGYNGSERFDKSERFGFFPSGGLGWYVSNENFFKEEWKKTVSKLKLKGTYGLVGNDAIGSEADRFFYLSNVNMTNSSKGSSFGTYGNSNTNVGRTLSGISISRYPNSDITWEIAQKLNLGIELGLFGKVEIQADYFSEHRSNILMDRASIPESMGLQSSIRANVGEAKSRGFDMSVDYNHLFNNDFWITGRANFTYATSEFTVYEEPDYSATPWLSRVGYSLSQGWGLVAERLFVDDEEIRNSPKQFGEYKAGDIKYKDINKDGKISDLDMVPMGYPDDPEIVYGFGLSVGFKNFDFSCFFQGLARESFWINTEETAPFLGDQRALMKAYADSHWSEDNRDIYALWPRLSTSIIDNNNRKSNWFMQNGSFLRLKSLEIGYTIPSRITNKIKMTDFRIYLNGTNLLTFSRFKLWDPEMGGKGLGYPIQKVYNIGLLFSF